MKYLRLFENFNKRVKESNDVLADILDESLVDLYDDGFSIVSKPFKDDEDGSIRVSLHKKEIRKWTGNLSIRCRFNKNEITSKRISTLRGAGSELKKNEIDLFDLVDNISHTIINLIDYKSGYFDIGYSVGSAMPYDQDREMDINIHMVFSNSEDSQ